MESALKSQLLLLLCITFVPSCVVARRPIAHTPPEESSWYKFSCALPEEGRRTLPARTVTAIQLAMDHFLPWNRKPSLRADPVSICLLQRQSWKVYAVPGPEDIVWVRISLSPGACSRRGPVANMGATYAVDTRQSRILAIQHP
jgi:hypothetical protein